jgi:hypothetical protein
VFLRANSNQLARDMSASWRYAAWAAAALIVSILQLGNVTPFLYFNF